jgi:hypothetical protein
MIPSTHHTGYRDRLRAVFLLAQSHRPALRLRLDHLWSGDRPRVGVCAIGLVELLFYEPFHYRLRLLIDEFNIQLFPSQKGIW